MAWCLAWSRTSQGQVIPDGRAGDQGRDLAGSSACRSRRYIHGADVILTLSNAIIYSGYPTAHVLSGRVALVN